MDIMINIRDIFGKQWNYFSKDWSETPAHSNISEIKNMLVLDRLNRKLDILQSMMFMKAAK